MSDGKRAISAQLDKARATVGQIERDVGEAQNHATAWGGDDHNMLRATQRTYADWSKTVRQQIPMSPALRKESGEMEAEAAALGKLVHNRHISQPDVRWPVAWRFARANIQMILTELRFMAAYALWIVKRTAVILLQGAIRIPGLGARLAIGATAFGFESLTHAADRTLSLSATAGNGALSRITRVSTASGQRIDRWRIRLGDALYDALVRILVILVAAYDGIKALLRLTARSGAAFFRMLAREGAELIRAAYVGTRALLRATLRFFRAAYGRIVALLRVGWRFAGESLARVGKFLARYAVDILISVGILVLMLGLIGLIMLVVWLIAAH